MSVDTQDSRSQNEKGHRVVSGRAAFHLAACEVAQKASLQLAILSFQLEREIYGDAAFADIVQTFATRHQHARLRILIHSPEWASRSGHRLVELGRQLSSFIEMRELAEQDKTVTHEVLIADENALLVRESPDQLEALFYPDSPFAARQWLHRYDLLWNSSVPVQGLRRLDL